MLTNRIVKSPKKELQDLNILEWVIAFHSTDLKNKYSSQPLPPLPPRPTHRHTLFTAPSSTTLAPSRTTATLKTLYY